MSGGRFVQQIRTVWAILSGDLIRNICVIHILNMDQWFWKIPFLDSSYLELWQPSGLAEQNRLSYFDKELYEEHFCKIFLNLDQWFRRCHLKYFLSTALAAILFGRV